MKNEINDPEPLVLTTLEAENTSTDNLLLPSTPKMEKFTVKDSLPRKWTKKDIPKKQQELFEFENTQAPTDVNLPPHKLFELFFNDEVINFSCDQSKIYANSKRNFTFHVTPDEFRAFLAVLLISGCTLRCLIDVPPYPPLINFSKIFHPGRSYSNPLLPPAN